MGNFITEENIDAMWLHFNDRILEICHHYRIQKKDIAKEIGVNGTRLSQRFGNAQHTIAYLILIHYPEINARWLLFGQGDMIDLPTPAPQEEVELPQSTQTSAEFQALLDRYTALAIENQMLKNQLNKQ